MTCSKSGKYHVARTGRKYEAQMDEGENSRRDLKLLRRLLWQSSISACSHWLLIHALSLRLPSCGTSQDGLAQLGIWRSGTRLRWPSSFASRPSPSQGISVAPPATTNRLPLMNSMERKERILLMTKSVAVCNNVQATICNYSHADFFCGNYRKKENSILIPSHDEVNCSLLH